MSSALPVYHGYHNLDKMKREIRLMTVSADDHRTAGSCDGGIVCALKQIPLDEANPFHALSYVWGPPGTIRPIWLDGQSISVRENLWLFLSCLRDRFCNSGRSNSTSTRTIRVWVDYVCINQQDDDERSSQVAMMGEIYRSADSVYAWLGEPTVESDRVCVCMEEIKALRAQNRRWASIGKEKQQTLQDLHGLTERPYWTRLWIKQEVVLAKDIWFFCGKHAINWKDFDFALSISTDLQRPQCGFNGANNRMPPDLSPASPATVDEVTALLHSRSSLSAKASLSELVSRFHQAGCSDGRDRIYGLLSLVNDGSSELIDVDYTKPLLQVLLENYPHWTGEAIQILSPTTSMLGNPVPVYQYNSFCAQMASLLSAKDLEMTHKSRSLRDKIAARGIVKTSLLRSATYHTIATLTDSDIVPLTEKARTRSGKHVFITLVEPENSTMFFMYSNVVPRHEDLFATIGPRIFMLQRSSSASASPQPRNFSFQLAGVGTIMESLYLHQYPSERCLRTLSLVHPIRWLHKQLPDATFELLGREVCLPLNSHSQPNSRAERVGILCNGAAIVMLLQESDVFSASSMSVESGGMISQGGLREQREHELDESVYWSPWHFGVENRLLDPCTLCTASGRYGQVPRSILQRPSQLHEPPVRCTCSWKNSSSLARAKTEQARGRCEKGAADFEEQVGQASNLSHSHSPSSHSCHHVLK